MMAFESDTGPAVQAVTGRFTVHRDYMQDELDGWFAAGFDPLRTALAGTHARIDRLDDTVTRVHGKIARMHGRPAVRTPSHTPHPCQPAARRADRRR